MSETGNLSKPQVDAPTAPPRVRRKPAFAVFFGLAILALLAGAGFFAWQQMAHRLAIEPEIAQVRGDIFQPAPLEISKISEGTFIAALLYRSTPSSPRASRT